MKQSRAIPMLLAAVVFAGSAYAGEAAPSPFDRCMALSASDPAAALTHVQAALLQQKDTAGIARLHLCRGHALLLSGKREQAVDEFQFAVSEAERLHDTSLLAHALLLRGEQRGNDGQYADAIADLKRGFELEAQLGNVTNQNYALTAIANLYADSNVREYELALQYYRQQLAGHVARGEVQNEATTHFNIASTLEKMEQLPAAQEEFEQALAIDRKRGASSDIAYDERALAVVLSKRGQHEAALRMLDHALQQYRSDKDEEGVASVLLSRGAALRRAGRSPQALANLDAARAYYQQQGDLRYLDKIYEELGLAQAASGNWHEAYAARGEQMRVKQELQKQLLDERSSRLRVQFHTEQAQRNNTALADALAAAVPTAMR